MGPKVDTEGSGLDSGTSSEDSIPKIIKLFNKESYVVYKTGKRKQIQRGLWVAAHLLNGELGGSGTETKNFTPMTNNANKRHSSQVET